MIKKIFIVLSLIIIFFGDAYGGKLLVKDIGPGHTQKTYTDINGEVIWQESIKSNGGRYAEKITTDKDGKVTSTSTIDTVAQIEFVGSIEKHEKSLKESKLKKNSEKESKENNTESKDEAGTEENDDTDSKDGVNNKEKTTKNLNNETSEPEQEAEKIKSEAKAKKDLAGKEYMIDLDNFGILTSLKKDTAQKTTENVLQTIITKMIVAFGVLALFIMTIGGGYMIFSHGQDELLSKGKGIFTSGLISLVIALSSGIIIKIVISLLY